jgi:hypothetical protein
MTFAVKVIRNPALALPHHSEVFPNDNPIHPHPLPICLFQCKRPIPIFLKDSEEADPAGIQQTVGG